MKTDSILSPGLFKSGLRRFWPLWLAGFIALFLGIGIPVYTAAPGIVHTPNDVLDKRDMLEGMWSILRLGAWFYALAGAIIVALALNEHLFDSRAATFVGSLPLKRPTVYVTLLVTGLVVLVGLPVLMSALLLPLRLGLGPVFAPGDVGQWCASAVSLAFVFYTYALLACHLAGTRPVAVLLYLVINFLAACLEAAVQLIVPALAYGLSAESSVLNRLSPAVWLIQVVTGWGAEGTIMWTSIGIYVLVAAAVMVGTGVLYGRRDLEVAGDSVSFASLRPVLRYLAGISTALLFGSIYRLLSFEEASSNMPMLPGEVIVLAALLAAGAFLGTLFAEMIMSRSANVLGKVWRGGMVLVGIALAFVACCHFDVFGMARRVPDPAEVEKVSIDFDYNVKDLTITSPEEIAAACELHRDLLSYGGAGERGMNCFNVTIAYKLKDGSILHRVYPVLSNYYSYLDGQAKPDEGTQVLDEFRQIANSPEGRASRYASLLDGDRAKQVVQLEYVLGDYSYTSLSLTPEESADLIETALRLDLVEEDAGDVFSNVKSVPEGAYDATLYVYRPLKGRQDDMEQLFCIQQMSEQTLPHVIAWLHEHHPEVELRPWN